jgi:hypothetical protein
MGGQVSRRGSEADRAKESFSSFGAKGESAELFFDDVVKNGLVFPDPGRQLLLDDLPYAVFALHPEDDAVAAVVTYVYGEKSFLKAVRLAEIEFPEAAIGFYELCELDVADKLYLHKAPFELR